MANRIELEIGSKRKVFTAPSSWDELSRNQLFKWCDVLQMELSRREALLMAVFMFYKLPAGIFHQFTPEHDEQLSETMEFLTKNKLTKNVLGYVTVFFKKYHGPANKLTNLTIAEFRRTELYYELLQKTGRKQYLYLLAATLFRPASGSADNDIRAKLTEKSVVMRAKLFTWALHPNALQAIKLFYEGCRDYIFKVHPVIYKAAPEGERKGKSSGGISDLEDHILAFSGGKLGNFNETSETNLFVFLKHMVQRIEEHERSSKK